MYDGLLDLVFRNEREIGGMESAHDSFIWNLCWHPLGHILVSCSSDHTSKFWCRNRPGEEMRDKYNTASALITEDTGEGEKSQWFCLVKINRFLLYNHLLG